MRKYIYTLFITLFAGAVFAQGDIHFTQYFNTPMWTNPAHAGLSYRDIRAVASYRNQWFTISQPYTTMNFSIDAPVYKIPYHGFFGAGLNFFQDKAGDGNLSTTNYSAFVAYHLDNGNSYLSAGFRGGMQQRKVDFGNLFFDEQWDGTGFNTSFPTVDGQGIASDQSMDFSAGINYAYAAKGTRFEIGGSYSHLTAPDIALGVENEPLMRRIIAHASAVIPNARQSYISYVPSFLFMNQGPNRIYIGGFDVKYLLQKRSIYTTFQNEQFLSLGLQYRYLDALNIVGQLQVREFKFGFSYDVNISKLTPASRSIGGIEFSITYMTHFQESRFYRVK